MDVDAVEEEVVVVVVPCCFVVFADSYSVRLNWLRPLTRPCNSPKQI